MFRRNQLRDRWGAYERASRLGVGTVSGLEKYSRPYRNGRDLKGTPRVVVMINPSGSKPTRCGNVFRPCISAQTTRHLVDLSAQLVDGGRWIGARN